MSSSVRSVERLHGGVEKETENQCVVSLSLRYAVCSSDALKVTTQ